MTEGAATTATKAGMQLFRGLLVLLLCLYVLFVSGVLLEGTPEFATKVVSTVEEILVNLGVPPASVGEGRVEFVLNALMFAPITLLASLAWPRHASANWVVYAFLLSGAAELLQGFVLDARSAQHVDIVANTLGGLLGTLMALPLVGQRRS